MISHSTAIWWMASRTIGHTRRWVSLRACRWGPREASPRRGGRKEPWSALRRHRRHGGRNRVASRSRDRVSRVGGGRNGRGPDIPRRATGFCVQQAAAGMLARPQRSGGIRGMKTAYRQSSGNLQYILKECGRNDYPSLKSHPLVPPKPEGCDCTPCRKSLDFRDARMEPRPALPVNGRNLACPWQFRLAAPRRPPTIGRTPRCQSPRPEPLLFFPPLLLAAVPRPPAPALSIVIVNFCQWRNTARLVGQFRRSIAMRTEAVSIVVVDNHSPISPARSAGWSVCAA